jgi:hypothetical protein
MKIEKYAEHLANVIVGEVGNEQYETARILAENLVEVLEIVMEKQDKRHKDEAKIRALSFNREITA